jgi:hypothetical protein
MRVAFYPIEKRRFFLSFFVYLVGSFAYAAQFVLLRDVWIRTQRAAAGSSRATNLATHLSNLANHLTNLATHLTKLGHPFCQLGHP